MFSPYDQRPTGEIVDYLMSTNSEDIDLLAVVTVLARRIDALESVLQNNKPNSADHKSWSAGCVYPHDEKPNPNVPCPGCGR